MARDDDRDGIAVVGETHGAESLGASYGASDVGVGAGFAVRDIKQSMPAADLERRTAEIKRKTEALTLPAEIFIKFAGVRANGGGGLFPRHSGVPREARRKFAAIEGEKHEPTFGGGQEKRASGRIHP